VERWSVEAWNFRGGENVLNAEAAEKLRRAFKTIGSAIMIKIMIHGSGGEAGYRGQAIES